MKMEYEKPELIVYGEMQDITAGNGSNPPQ